MEEKQKVIVYIDGFNFYYGLKASPWKKYYWIDVVKLMESFMRPDQELVAVKYFSARPTDTGKRKRQDAFFQANKENPKFQLILGKYLRKTIECFRCHNMIRTYEEKESDVRIATQIVADAFKHNCDIAIIVSADSDMIPAVELAKETQTKVFVYFPPNHYSSNLAVMGNGIPIQMQRYEARFKKALLPDEIVLANGFHLSMPEKWKENRQTEKKAERIQQLQFIMESLKQDGFEGFKTIGELKENQKGIPEEQGVYVVLYSQPQEPSFLEKGTGGFFKDKNPNVEISELKENWVDGEGIVYIGKAGGGNSKATLQSRLAQYLKFGMGRKIGHWGGRYIWQLADADSLIVCWKTTTENPRDVEADMIAKFKAGHDGRRPFANLSD